MSAELTGMTGVVAERLLPQLGHAARQRVGLPEAGRPPLVAALAAERETALLLVASTPAKAQALFDELKAYVPLQMPLARLPERERLPYELARDDEALMLERSRALSLLRGDSGLVVASWLAVSERLAGPSAVAVALTVALGSPVDPSELVRRAEAQGYRVDAIADRPGTVARRGGIVDVFPADSQHPVRIEFFGSEVESIREVDLATQRSRGRLESVTLPAVATGTGEARAAAGELATRVEGTSEDAETFIEQLELIAGGGRTEWGMALEPLLHETCALDHMAPATVVVLDDPDEGRASLSAAWDHERRTQEELEHREAIPRGLPPLLTDPESLAARLERWEPALVIEPFGAEEFGAHRLPVGVAPSFAGKLRTVVEQSLAWARQGRAVVIASQQALRLADLFEEGGAAAHLTRTLNAAPGAGMVTLVPLAVAGGFMLGEEFALITDTEVFGLRKRRRPHRTRTGIREDIVSTLEVGDYLVHADHGIGRFGGLVRRTVDGAQREYLELQYAEGDRLFVPVDQLEAVSRYIGQADRAPSLTRLGSQEWSRTKSRVRRAIAEIAQELLELYARRELAEGYAYGADNAWQMEMEAAFPFVETADQLEAIAEVKTDMENLRPMDRLICGDVGYGKTEVAVRAAFKAVTEGKQVAVLVPTTVLAEQHGATFRERTAGFPVRIDVLSRFRSDQEQRDIVEAIESGEADIVIGTHRLLQKDVKFRDLGLVIIDEEQRFGVAHKERLKEMKSEVDALSLSATPIPRTLQMSLAGIRDMSTVMTPPEERLPVRTYVTEWDDEVIREAIERELERGGQVYFVHNRVHNIERILGRLRKIVPEADITVGHGQMPEQQLERVMLEFAAGDHDVLVCTTIIESGLDIPNVNTIIINDANTLGLAQLYQLRGRVGRGANRAYAYLLYDRSRAISETAQKRLEAIFEATELGSGFQIALRDLEIRGAGNVLGAEQSGHIASVGFDMYSKLLAEAVSAIKRGMLPEGKAGPAPLPPPPPVDLPLSAHIPPTYIDDMHARLALYQRIAGMETAAQVADMQEELADRFGAVPPAVENLLYVALVRSMARVARVESIKTDEHMFHIRVRGGTTDAQRETLGAMGLEGVLVGPNQVRIDRFGAGEGWMQLLVRILRAMADPELVSRSAEAKLAPV